MVLVEYVDFRQESVAIDEKELVRTTGSSLSILAKTFLPPLTTTQWKYEWSSPITLSVVGSETAAMKSFIFTTISLIARGCLVLQEMGL